MKQSYVILSYARYLPFLIRDYVKDHKNMFACFMIKQHWDGEDIKNNAWVTVNNEFWVTSEAICQ